MFVFPPINKTLANSKHLIDAIPLRSYDDRKITTNISFVLFHLLLVSYTHSRGLHLGKNKNFKMCFGIGHHHSWNMSSKIPDT